MPETIQPPHSVEAEEALLGSVLIDPLAMLRIRDRLTADMFYIVRNGWVWDALCRVEDDPQIVIDYLTVIEALKDAGHLDEIGGPSYLMRLMNRTPTTLYAETYAEIVRRNAVRRRMLGAASEIATLAHDTDQDLHDVVDLGDLAWRRVATVARNPFGHGGKLSGLLSLVYDDVEDRKKAKDSGRMTGVPSGLSAVDALTGGLQNSDLIIVASRPGMGKTSWLVSVARNAARRGARVGLCPLEMSDRQITERLIAMETGLASNKLRSGELNDHEWGLFVAAHEPLSKLPLFVDENISDTVTKIRATALEWHNEDGLDLLMIDYLQLMQEVKSKHGDTNKAQAVGEITRGLKMLARELNIPVIAAAQLNRGVESRQDKRPTLSDLRDSGRIEEDADIVLLLYRDDYYHDNSDRPNQAELNFAKHRNGPTDTVRLYFKKQSMEFVDIAPPKRVDLSGYGKPTPTHAAATGGDA